MPVASLAPAIIGGASSILGGIFGSSAAKSASKDQQASLQQAINQTTGAVQGFQGAVSNANNQLGNVLGWQQDSTAGVLGQQQNTLQGVLGQQQNTLAPYLAAGQTGLNTLQGALAPGGSLTQQFSFDPNSIASNPDYQFNMQQGLQAVQRASAANGTLNSGGTAKSLAQFASGLASNEMTNAYNRAFNTFSANRANTLQNATLPISIGQQATSMNQNALQNYGSSNTNALQNYGGLNFSGLQNYGNLNSQNLLAGGQAGMQGAQQINSLLGAQGNAKAAGDIGSQNAWTNTLGQVTGALQSKPVANWASQYDWFGSGGGGGTGAGASPFPAPPQSSNYAYPYSAPQWNNLGVFQPPNIAGGATPGFSNVLSSMGGGGLPGAGYNFGSSGALPPGMSNQLNPYAFGG